MKITQADPSWTRYPSNPHSPLLLLYPFKHYAFHVHILTTPDWRYQLIPIFFSASLDTLQVSLVTPCCMAWLYTYPLWVCSAIRDLAGRSLCIVALFLNLHIIAINWLIERGAGQGRAGQLEAGRQGRLWVIGKAREMCVFCRRLLMQSSYRFGFPPHKYLSVRHS